MPPMNTRKGTGPGELSNRNTSGDGRSPAMDHAPSRTVGKAVGNVRNDGPKLLDEPRTPAETPLL